MRVSRAWRSGLAALPLMLLGTGSTFGEGSREFMSFEQASGGNVRYKLICRDVLRTTIGNPRWTVFRVYMQAGETLHVG